MRDRLACAGKREHDCFPPREVVVDRQAPSQLARLSEGKHRPSTRASLQSGLPRSRKTPPDCRPAGRRPQEESSEDDGVVANRKQRRITAVFGVCSDRVRHHQRLPHILVFIDGGGSSPNRRLPLRLSSA